MNRCAICCSYENIEKHHIIKRSQSKALINCKYNIINLCSGCHKKVHGKDGKKLDTKLKTGYYLKMRKLFRNDKYTIKEIKDKLEISSNEAERLCKTINTNLGYICREELLLALMGYKLVLEVSEI